MHTTIRPRTISLLGKLIHPLVDEGLITVAESRDILANLRSLATKGTLLPPVEPRLLTPEQAADLLGISYSQFKKLEREGAFPFRRRMVGSSVRYSNLAVIAYVMEGLGEEGGGGEPHAVLPL